MPRRRHKSNHRTALVVVLLIAGLGLIIPNRFTGGLISLVQVIVPFQDWTTRSADAVSDAVTPGEGVPSPEEVEQLRRANAALRHQLATLSVNYDQLQNDFADVAGIRRLGVTGGRLIPARVVAADAVPWRDSRLVSAGSLAGVRHQAAVTSHRFTIAADRPDELVAGELVLAGEVLVGFVEQVGTHAARVRMLTDEQTSLKVTIARYDAGNYHPLDAEFWMTGTGKPQLEVRDVDHRYIRDGAIQKGDFVLTTATDPRLPAALTVGTITAITRDNDNALLYQLTVEPPLAGDDIGNVFILDLAARQTP